MYLRYVSPFFFPFYFGTVPARGLSLFSYSVIFSHCFRSRSNSASGSLEASP